MAYDFMRAPVNLLQSVAPRHQGLLSVLVKTDDERLFSAVGQGQADDHPVATIGVLEDEHGRPK